MKLDYTKNLDELTEKELMQFIISAQLLTLTKLDEVLTEIKNEKMIPHHQTTEELVFKITSNIDRINDALAKQATD